MSMRAYARIGFVAGGVGYVPLYGRGDNPRAWALVDAVDFPDVIRFNWHLSDTGYACRWYNGRPPRRKRDRMHRRVLGLGHDDGRQCDHINRNRLDNRRENLRPVTDGENKQNCDSYRGSTSEYRGVSWDKDRDRWVAQAKEPGTSRTIFLGRFTDELAAAEAAREYRAEYMPYSRN